MARPDKTSSALGAVAAVSAFLMWGLLPIYWIRLRVIEWEPMMAYRTVWTVIFAAVLVTASGRWPEVTRVFRSKVDALRATATSLLIGINWMLFLWAATHDHLVECSLGYFINPLVSVLLGCVFLRERMRGAKIVALLFGAAGVTSLLVQFGQFPWIAMSLACSFGLYGLLRKTARAESLPGLMVETGLMAIPAVIYIALQPGGPTGVFTPLDATETTLLLASGIATSLPLLCFGYGARRIALSTVGFLQYIGPTCMFLLAVFVYQEQLSDAQLIAFPLIWFGLAIYSWDAIRNRPASQAVTQPVNS